MPPTFVTLVGTFRFANQGESIQWVGQIKFLDLETGSGVTIHIPYASILIIAFRFRLFRFNYVNVS